LPEVLKVKKRYYKIFRTNPVHLQYACKFLYYVNNLGDGSRAGLVEKLRLQYPDSAATYLLTMHYEGSESGPLGTLWKIARLSSWFKKTLEHKFEREGAFYSIPLATQIREFLEPYAGISLPEKVPDSVLLDLMHFSGMLQPFPDYVLAM
jgi:hypothetical protein